ncbi:hypothetical protein J0X19_11640 [Hymenobacter sp. BT186]|uniref:Restriction endonuclease type II NotI domain-containing protein n=1 Tax=Hymenobacter telluris TaxID=2816474 RepID=A0A939JCQ1_9BACT|nr:NotI family restriction endonuclease [Hymenobacter telluris]MBO0358600.1 hypothetical protein [Hymenobacter telluris]MBW3374626.1 hypothetical protein [Hymenobacter norwichensis]
MPIDPTTIICEILGQPAPDMRNPANADYECPFLSGPCTKRSPQLEGPYPVCTIFRPNSTDPICVCPKRLNEIDIVKDVLENCWPGTPPNPANIKVTSEVHLGHLGNMDLVIAELTSSGHVKKFVSVEYQAIDITGSYFPAYTALTNSDQLKKKSTLGLNWMNVYKRYVTQLIGKGFQHHQWNTIMISVMQETVMNRMLKIGNINEVPLNNSNIVFLGYKYVFDSEENVYKLELSRVYPTTHQNITNGPLYREVIDVHDAKAKILSRMNGE